MKSAAALYKDMNPQSAYYDRRSSKYHPYFLTHYDCIDLPKEEYTQRLKTSTTLYVGNLSFYTLES